MRTYVCGVVCVRGCCSKPPCVVCLCVYWEEGGGGGVGGRIIDVSFAISAPLPGGVRVSEEKKKKEKEKEKKEIKSTWHRTEASQAG